MKRRPTRASALVMVTFWAVQAIAQPSDGNSASTDHELRFSVGHPIEVERANPINMLRWAASVYFNPEDQLTPLFGYSVSGIQADNIGDAVAASMEGNVRIAILTRRENGSDAGSDDVFEGRGVQIAVGIGDGRLRDEWERFLQSANVQRDDVMIAFTRPLLDREADEEFVATSHLWAPSDSGLAATETNPGPMHVVVE